MSRLRPRRPPLPAACRREQPYRTQHDALRDELNHEGHVLSVHYGHIREVDKHRLGRGVDKIRGRKGGMDGERQEGGITSEIILYTGGQLPRGGRHA